MFKIRPDLAVGVHSFNPLILSQPSIEANEVKSEYNFINPAYFSFDSFKQPQQQQGRLREIHQFKIASSLPSRFEFYPVLLKVSGLPRNLPWFQAWENCTWFQAREKCTFFQRAERSDQSNGQQVVAWTLFQKYKFV